MMPIPHALKIHGTLWFCPSSPPRPCGKYVYQGVAPGKGNIPGNPKKDTQLRRYVVPFDPRTAPQLSRRARFAAAVAAWHTLGPAEKKAWRQRGESRRLPGYQAFISAWMRA
jgi:hypothetical protein